MIKRSCCERRLSCDVVVVTGFDVEGADTVRLVESVEAVATDAAGEGFDTQGDDTATCEGATAGGEESGTRDEETGTGGDAGGKGTNAGGEGVDAGGGGTPSAEDFDTGTEKITDSEKGDSTCGASKLSPLACLTMESIRLCIPDILRLV